MLRIAKKDSYLHSLLAHALSNDDAGLCVFHFVFHFEGGIFYQPNTPSWIPGIAEHKRWHCLASCNDPRHYHCSSSPALITGSCAAESFCFAFLNLSTFPSPLSCCLFAPRIFSVIFLPHLLFLPLVIVHFTPFLPFLQTDRLLLCKRLPSDGDSDAVLKFMW